MDNRFKHSGAEWIGTIPTSWATTTVGQIYKERRTKVSDKDYAPLSVTMRGIVPQLEFVVKTEDNDNRKLILQGDFVINSRSDRRGALGVSDYDGSCSVINTVLYSKDGSDVRYYNYAFQTPLFPDEYYRFGHGIVDDLWTTRWSEMKNIILPDPDKQTQKRIADYLDRFCARIQIIIDRTRTVIEEYKLLKNSAITEAIEGKNSMPEACKQSGLKWIGFIPENWSVYSARQICFPVKDPNKALEERNLLSLSYGHIIRKDIDSTEGLIPESYDGYNIVGENDIVLRLTDLQNDHKSLRVGFVTEKGIITSAYLTIRTTEFVNPKYLYYYLHAYDVAKGFYSMGGGIRQSLAWDEFKSLKIAMPPIEEQEQIVCDLDKKCERYDFLIAERERYLEMLAKYKKSIIYDYVTGKKEVPACQ